MKMRRIAVPALLALAACAVPASAGAATLAPGKPCFGDGDPLSFGGTGYTPNAPVSFAADGRPITGTRTASPTGVVTGAVFPFSLVTGRTQNTVVTATDTANPVNIGQATLLRSRLRVSVTPANASPRSSRRFRARGFTAGSSTLYRHITRGRSVSNGRMGKLGGACKTLSVKKRLFRRSAPSGTYRVQFDTKRKYSSKTVQRVRFRVRVYRIVRRASSASTAAATHGEVWTQVR